jgi:hypothetical protein
MEVVERELRTMESGIRSPGKLFGAIVSGSKRSEVVGEVMLALLSPATSAAQHAEDRSQASLQLLQVAAALAIHRAENGAYPDTLDEISADLRAELPVDPFTEKSFLYEKRGDGFVLWSVGQNLVNDKASGDRFFSTVGGEPAIDGQATRGNQDDIVLRVPWVEPTEANASDGS